jgi:hypothetical protein
LLLSSLVLLLNALRKPSAKTMFLVAACTVIMCVECCKRNSVACYALLMKPGEIPFDRKRNQGSSDVFSKEKILSCLLGI